MGRADVGGAFVDQTALWAAEEEIRLLRQAQEAMNRHMAALVAAARRGAWREVNELSDFVAWRRVEERYDYWRELGTLCAMVGLSPEDMAQIEAGRCLSSAKR